MKVILRVCDINKYSIKAQIVEEIEYDILEYKVVSGEDAELIDGSCIDDNNEYLVLTLNNGETVTYRNTYVDMFRIYYKILN